MLKNQANLLPLDPAKFKNIAVIGPNAYPGYATGGGSGMVPPFFVTGPFRGISDYLGVRGNVTTIRESPAPMQWPRRPA